MSPDCSPVGRGSTDWPQTLWKAQRPYQPNSPSPPPPSSLTQHCNGGCEIRIVGQTEERERGGLGVQSQTLWAALSCWDGLADLLCSCSPPFFIHHPLCPLPLHAFKGQTVTDPDLCDVFVGTLKWWKYSTFKVRHASLVTWLITSSGWEQMFLQGLQFLTVCAGIFLVRLGFHLSL